MKANVLVSFLAALTLNACSSDNPTVKSFADTRIIGGAEVVAADPILRSIVIVHDVKHGFLCTGSILSESLILTAAHCAEHGFDGIYIRFSTDLANKDAPAAKVTAAVMHPNYLIKMTELDSQLQAIEDTSASPAEKEVEIQALLNESRNWGDLALLKFAGGLPPGYAPANILSDSSALKNGTSVTLAGFGITRSEAAIKASGVNDPVILRKVSVAVADAHFSETEATLDQRHGKGGCHGDSGGPAYVEVNGQLMLWGVTSRGINDSTNSCSGFSVYTDVLTLEDWIRETAITLNNQM